jgi:site-specific recombinase XerD
VTDGPPRKIAPREAMERWLNSLRNKRSEQTIETYYYRLKLFVEWCDQREIESVDELSGWVFDTYESVRLAEDVAPTTLNGELQTLKNWVEYLERLEVVPEGLAEKVPIPEVPVEARSDEEMLRADAAEALLTWYRDEPAVFGTVKHAWLELAWHTGARMGGIRGLDLRDFDPDRSLVEFRHRPSTGTPLKNKRDGERPVAFPAFVTGVLERYIDHHRLDIHDEHGRAPLFTTNKGRPVANTMRVWSYQATFPCHHGACPHEKDPQTCEFKTYRQSSKCPSSRSPHKIRTGSITWQRDLGFPPEVVAERVNASMEVIGQYYDHADALDRLEQRRRPYISDMEFNS